MEHRFEAFLPLSRQRTEGHGSPEFDADGARFVLYGMSQVEAGDPKLRTGLLRKTGNPAPRQRKPLADTINAPFPYLSSNQAICQDVVAEVVLEPTELHHWKRPTTPDVRLMLFAGGPLRFDSGGADRANPIVREGDFILRPGIEPYEVGWKSLSSAPTRSLVLHLDRDLLLHTAEHLDGGDPARIVLMNRVGFRDSMLREICLTLWRELEKPAGVWRLYVQTAAQMLAVHLLQHYAAAPVHTKDFTQILSQRQLKAVTDLVMDDLSRNLTLSAMAAQAGLSPYYFARLFRTTTGTSPHQFVLARRLERAQHLLKETKMALADVALDAGFANQSHLTREFKRRFGLTPKAYRGKL